MSRLREPSRSPPHAALLIEPSVTKLGGGAVVPTSSRALLAVVVALVGVALGQLGLWWYAGTEGGVLPLVDYLAETFGLLVPLQALLAAGFAWWGAR